MGKPPLTLFGWPGALGGSETKLTALGKLLSRDFQITWVPNDDAALIARSCGRGALGDGGELRGCGGVSISPSVG